ncbi:GIY-YIG nuclease family protein [Caulobacter soli]|uniref:GIY-YIG nuclease family protein n=1 Tax=Caulobacter soli TaxID=2708539 RepID=UPI0013ED5F01|nr:hypothetical protein [Caulobacter soli]
MSSFPAIASSEALFSRSSLTARPSPVPAEAGIYAWFFRKPLPGVDVSGCYQLDGYTLLYIGISPKEPSRDGFRTSRSNLRQRLRTHIGGNAEGSTLRKTLGCLLAPETGFPLRRVGTGRRLTFTNPGERALDAWMDENAFVTWQVTAAPWNLERQILSSGLPLPLNIRDNPCEAHVNAVRAIRGAAVSAALELPIVADSGGPRRLAASASKSNEQLS